MSHFLNATDVKYCPVDLRQIELSEFGCLAVGDSDIRCLAALRSALGKPLTVVVHTPTWIAEA